ncbi:MAG: hypothetical protein IT383_18515 [Deltaproteobacteria bacterium]|nr:hypothetical protein [Deltaproteobacteria bacterium]
MISIFLSLALPAGLALPVGPAPAALGITRDDEASPEGPGSLAVDPEGRLWVLDAVHARIAVVAKDGALEGNVPLPSTTIEDLALLPSGDVAVLDRLVARRVFVLTTSGAVIADADVEGAGVDEGGLVTGIFADESGVWLEVQHGVHVRVLDGRLSRDASRVTRPGLPLGEVLVRVRKVGDAAQVLFLDPRGALRGDAVVHFSSLLELSGLVAHHDGARPVLWVAGHELVQRPGAPPERDRIVVARLERGADGHLREVARTEMRASPEFVPLKQLVPAGPGHVAHLFVDTSNPGSGAAVEVSSW